MSKQVPTLESARLPTLRDKHLADDIQDTLEQVEAKKIAKKLKTKTNSV